MASQIIIVHAGEAIYVDLGIHGDQQSLQFNGEFLKNMNKVGDYEITEGGRMLLRRGIPILINTPTAHFWLIVEDTTTVHNLKDELETKTAIPAERMKLLVGHREMDDYYAMYTYGIHEGSEIGPQDAFHPRLTKLRSQPYKFQLKLVHRPVVDLDWVRQAQIIAFPAIHLKMSTAPKVCLGQPNRTE
ncbi:hypothetical protein L1049_004158 [Liquidambar formosana]|uniref:Ubiquitin-like domain-containing protein n=1 Tax=Liquidambar formosana TaxID=63359 RepID=A0AAP0RMV7_LIQFO